MRKIYLSAAMLLYACMLLAQTPANRTAKTIVADMLAQMPVDKQVEYEKLIGELSTLGEEGVQMLVNRINPPGKGDNSKVDYALSGLTCYVAAQKNKAIQQTVSEAYQKALKTTTEYETKAFIIRQLQLLGDNECVETLASLLNDEKLCSPACCALVAIGSDDAKVALTSALKLHAGSQRTLKSIIQAIGDIQATQAEEILIGMLSSNNINLRPLLLQALAKTGTLQSLDVLAKEAASEGYKVNKSNATRAYVTLLGRMVMQGHAEEVEKAVHKLQKLADKSGEEQIRIATLHILLQNELARTGWDTSKADKLVLKALKDGSKDYRNATLDFASSFAGDKLYTGVIKMLNKAATEEKIEILNWLRREAASQEKRECLQALDTKNGKALDVIVSQLDAAEFEVKQAAAWLLVRIGNEQTMPQLASLLKSTDLQTVLLGQDVLASCSGKITTAVVNVIPLASASGKVAALELLAMRKDDTSIETVLAQLNSNLPEVKQAAYIALKDVVGGDDITCMFKVLESADAAYITPAQDAVIEALASLPTKEQIKIVNQQMVSAGTKDFLYYRVLAATHLPEVLDLLVERFNTDKGKKKDAAFAALLELKTNRVAAELYKICLENPSSAYFTPGLDTYITLVSAFNLTGEQRLLGLRKAMEIARTDIQKKEILRQIGNTGTFLGLLYAGEFLEQKAVQQEAANAIMNIALSNKQYMGTNVRELLRKVIDVLDNPDAIYQKEAIRKHLAEMPDGEGFVPMFNGKDLTGWKGLVSNPLVRAKMSSVQLAQAQKKADEQMRRDWKVENGLLVFDGTGFDNLCTVKQYGDFEMYVDWMLDPSGKEADAGIYLRGTPQVQIWDTARTNVGAQVGSGGLYNNQVNTNKPKQVADNPLGEWNSFYIKMVGDRVTVLLNGKKVVDDVILENYWDRNLPIFPIEQIELQAHGSKVYYRNLYIKELERVEPFKLSEQEKKEGFKVLFDGTNMHQWTGNTVDYTLEDHCISMNPSKSFGGNLYTVEEYSDFVFRFEFQLTPGANNGVGIRAPLEGDAAYVGMEVQVLDCEHPIYKDITPLQHHGSVYGIIPSNANHLHAIKPAGEWNEEEIYANGDNIRVTVNGVVILEGNIREATKNGTADGQKHPGLFNKKGHIGFLGHGSPVKFRNIRIKELK